MRLWFCALGLALASLAPASEEVDAIVARFQSPDRTVRQAAVKEFVTWVEASMDLVEKAFAAGDSGLAFSRFTEVRRYYDYASCGEYLPAVLEATTATAPSVAEGFLRGHLGGIESDAGFEPSDFQELLAGCGTGDHSWDDALDFVLRRRPQVAERLLAKPDLKFRGFLLRRLAEIGYGGARKWAFRFCGASQRGLRASGVEALAKFPDSNSRATVLRLAADPSGQVRTSVAEALRTWQDDESARTLVRLLEDRRLMVVLEASASLTSWRTAVPAVSTAYLRMLRERPAFQQIALTGLLCHPTSEAIPDLRALLKGSDAPIGDALAALAAIEDAKARTIVFGYLDDPNRELRAAAVNALGYMKSPSADTFLIQALRDPDQGIFWVACEAVGRKGAPRAIPVLRELLHTRKDDTPRIESALRNCLGLKDDEPIPTP
jgi:hypothetical protein